MSTLLDVAGIAFNLAYFGFFISAMRKERRGTLKGLIEACQAFWTAAALQTCAFLTDVASIPYDGWLWPVLSGATVGLCVAIAMRAGRDRDRKVIDEMWRDLDPWGSS